MFNLHNFFCNRSFLNLFDEYVFLISILAGVYRDYAKETVGLSKRSQILGGGRLRHVPEEKAIFIFGESMVCYELLPTLFNLLKKAAKKETLHEN